MIYFNPVFSDRLDQQRLTALMLHLASELPYTPSHIDITSVDAQVVIAYERLGEVDTEFPLRMGPAIEASGTRITAENQSGEYQYSIIHGSKGTYLLVMLGREEYMLGIHCWHVDSLDSMVQGVMSRREMIDRTLRLI